VRKDAGGKDEEPEHKTVADKAERDSRAYQSSRAYVLKKNKFGVYQKPEKSLSCMRLEEGLFALKLWNGERPSLNISNLAITKNRRLSECSNESDLSNEDISQARLKKSPSIQKSLTVNQLKLLQNVTGVGQNKAGLNSLNNPSQRSVMNPSEKESSMSRLTERRSSRRLANTRLLKTRIREMNFALSVKRIKNLKLNPDYYLEYIIVYSCYVERRSAE